MSSTLRRRKHVEIRKPYVQFPHVAVIGDSFQEGLYHCFDSTYPTSPLFVTIYNGSCNDFLEQVALLPETVAVLFLHIGSDDIAQETTSVDQIVQSFVHLYQQIEKNRPEIQRVIVSIINPRALNSIQSPDFVYSCNQKAVDFNKVIYQLCYDHLKLRYISYGFQKLPPTEVLEKDGYHPSRLGLFIIAKIISETIGLIFAEFGDGSYATRKGLSEPKTFNRQHTTSILEPRKRRGYIPPLHSNPESFRVQSATSRSRSVVKKRSQKIIVPTRAKSSGKLVDCQLPNWGKSPETPDSVPYNPGGAKDKTRSVYSTASEMSRKRVVAKTGQPPPRSSRRKSVFAEHYDPAEDDDDDDVKPVFPKSEEDRERLGTAVKNILLFRALEAPQLKEVIDAMFERKVIPGEIIIREGDDGDNFYVIQSGTYNIYKNVDQEKDKLVGKYEGSGSFGELALLYNMPRAATIQAVTDGSLWAVNRQTFRKIVLKSAHKKRMEYEKLLEKVPMLKHLNPYERMSVCDALMPRSYQAGQVIIKQGDKGDGMYIIEDGQVKITMKKENEEVDIAMLSKGAYFGELALVTRKPRAASAYAVGNVRLAFLDVSAFERLLGPCMDIMKRNIADYEQQVLRLFGSRTDCRGSNKN